MAKKSKGKLQTRKDKAARRPRREERRFVSHASANPMAVYGLGALSALLLGAGGWGLMFAQSLAEDEKLKNAPSYLIAIGAVVLGITIWIGTSAEPTIRVGDPGVAVEKGDTRRMPWWGIEKITFESGALALGISGTDEMGTAWTFKVPLKSHPEAVGWIIKEALARIPRRVDIDDATLEKLPGANAQAGERLELEPLQVVGKRCAATNKIISYEPDARVCRRCERVYLRTEVPKKCKCGNSLADLRPKDAADGDEGGESDAEENETESDERDSGSERSGSNESDRTKVQSEPAES